MQTQNLGAPQGPDQIHQEPSVSPFDNGGSAGIFENIELDHESHSWIDFSPGDYTEDDGVPTPNNNHINVSSSLTPADDSLHLAQFKGLSFAPCSSATYETTAPCMALPSGGPSPGVDPLYTGYQEVRSFNPSTATAALSIAKTWSTRPQILLQQ
jgi:hypothetical protein